MTHRWYIIHTLSGSERRVKQSILEQAAKQNLEGAFDEIIIPVVEVPEIKRGKNVKVEKKFMPGYILIKMDMTDECWHLVKNVAKVTGFLGSGGKPQPVPDREVEVILSQLELKAQDAAKSTIYNVGESVLVLDGPFESFTGVIEDIDAEKERMRVSVLIFGRATPIDLTFAQVKKDTEV